MISTRQATDTTSRTQRARIYDGSARHGLTIRHLRAFLEQVELTDFDDDTEVHLTDKLNATDPLHTVEISSSRTSSESVDLPPRKAVTQ